VFEITWCFRLFGFDIRCLCHLSVEQSWQTFILHALSSSCHIGNNPRYDNCLLLNSNTSWVCVSEAFLKRYISNCSIHRLWWHYGLERLVERRENITMLPSNKLKIAHTLFTHSYQLPPVNKSSSEDEIANVNVLRQHRTCRGQSLCPLSSRSLKIIRYIFLFARKRCRYSRDFIPYYISRKFFNVLSFCVFVLWCYVKFGLIVVAMGCVV